MRVGSNRRSDKKLVGLVVLERFGPCVFLVLLACNACFYYLFLKTPRLLADWIALRITWNRSFRSASNRVYAKTRTRGQCITR